MQLLVKNNNPNSKNAIQSTKIERLGSSKKNFNDSILVIDYVLTPKKMDKRTNRKRQMDNVVSILLQSKHDYSFK